MAKTQSRVWEKLFTEPVSIGDGLGLNVDLAPEDGTGRERWMAVNVVALQPRTARCVIPIMAFLAREVAKTGSAAANTKGYNRGVAHDAAYQPEVFEQISSALRAKGLK